MSSNKSQQLLHFKESQAANIKRKQHSYEQPVGSTLVLWHLPHMRTLRTQAPRVSLLASVSLMITQGSNDCWCQEDTVNYALKICPMSPHFTTRHHNSSQNLEESSLSFLHIPYQTRRQIKLPLHSKIYSEPTVYYSSWNHQLPLHLSYLPSKSLRCLYSGLRHIINLHKLQTVNRLTSLLPYAAGSI